ncbi:hypothetical protein JHK82_015953 [Glycine max]|nr:hypothetical protein JHK85_016351 [Glycine max]KAG5046573.1 hypothetical protein JHK86_015979 [Glycine max]KAG5149072.1 hypothetical protein JHK82_015953 [Glycine max]
MLESMINHPTPTRAKVSDIAIAVRQGVDAIMLSGETAHGNFPLKVVKVMQTVALRNEPSVQSEETFLRALKLLLLVLSTRSGVNGFTLDPSLGEIILTHLDIKMENCKYPKDGSSPKSLRYIGSVLYGVFPMSFLMEQAGGHAFTGNQRMLDCSEAEQSKAATFVFGLDLLGYDMDWDTSGEAPAIQYRDDI